MPSNEIRLTTHVAATPERVWEVLTDLDGAEHTLSGVTRIERVGGDGYRVGTRWRETRTMFGREATEEMWVAEVDAPHRTVVRARSGGTEYATVFTLTPTGSGTDLAMTFAADPGTSVLHRLLAATVGRLGAAVTRKVMTTDLRDIAARAERI
ncbi:SRPBCC family protein [Rhodococcus sp. NPDC058505]|uniref:SRPBCC family protein n=1 Tax=unclassified Rhodococcus (in: high G+C Gram-positive bacteria) TaxID=192944 RepID=UPI0036507C36